MVFLSLGLLVISKIKQRRKRSAFPFRLPPLVDYGPFSFLSPITVCLNIMLRIALFSDRSWILSPVLHLSQCLGNSFDSWEHVNIRNSTVISTVINLLSSSNANDETS